MACCDRMESELRRECSIHGQACPDVLLRVTESGRVGIPIRDGGTVRVNFCPWCGTCIGDPPLTGHPMQYMELDSTGVSRFRVNPIIRHILNCGQAMNLNSLGSLDFPVADWEQLYQLIGYSLSGYGDLTRVSQSSVNRADSVADFLLGIGLPTTIQGSPCVPPTDSDRGRTWHDRLEDDLLNEVENDDDPSRT